MVFAEEERHYSTAICERPIAPVPKLKIRSHLRGKAQVRMFVSSSGTSVRRRTLILLWNSLAHCPPLFSFLMFVDYGLKSYCRFPCVSRDLFLLYVPFKSINFHNISKRGLRRGVIRYRHAPKKVGQEVI